MDATQADAGRRWLSLRLSDCSQIPLNTLSDISECQLYVAQLRAIPAPLQPDLRYTRAWQRFSVQAVRSKGKMPQCTMRHQGKPFL